MGEVSVAILGLGRIGTSIGLALKRYNEQGKQHQFSIIGYDSTSSIAKTAQKMGAVDSVGNRLDNIVADKDIIVMTLPLADVEAGYDLMSSRVRSGAVILDFSHLAQKSLEYGKKYLPEDAHVICVHPVLNPEYLFDGVDKIDKASADYFDNGTMLVMPSVKSLKESIELAADFSTILGMRVHYTDPAEHDGLVTATEALPSVLSVMYFYAMSKNLGWLDAQRLTNPTFGMLTHKLMDTHPDDIRDLWLDSSEGLVLQLDELIAQLRTVRGAIARKDRDALEVILEDSSREYEGWYNRRHSNHWKADEHLDSQAPSAGTMMGNMMGNIFGGFRRGGRDNDNN